MRTHAKDPTAIVARHRTATGRDTRDIETAQRDALAGKFAARRKRHLAVSDQRDVGAGAAHVERYKVTDAKQFAAAPRARHTSCGAGQHRRRTKP